MAYPTIEKAERGERTDTLALNDKKNNLKPIETKYKITCAWGCGCCVSVEPLTLDRLNEHIGELEEQLRVAKTVLAELQPGEVTNAV